MSSRISGFAKPNTPRAYDVTWKGAVRERGVQFARIMFLCLIRALKPFDGSVRSRVEIFPLTLT